MDVREKRERDLRGDRRPDNDGNTDTITTEQEGYFFFKPTTFYLSPTAGDLYSRSQEDTCPGGLYFVILLLQSL